MSDDMTLVAPEAAPSPAPDAPAVDPAASPIDGANENQPEQSGENDDQKTDKPRQKASERISEIYGRMKNAERARDLALAEVERLRQPVVDANQWDQLTFEQQQNAQMRQAVRAERADEMEREAYNRQRETANERATIYRERIESIRSTIPDIETVIHDPSLPVTEVGARFIAESDKGPQVAYWLGTNRAEAARIARLDPMSQAYELGKIEARIGSVPASRRLSNAPAPVPKVGGGGAPGGKDPSSMSMAEYAEWAKKRG